MEGDFDEDEDDEEDDMSDDDRDDDEEESDEEVCLSSSLVQFMDSNLWIERRHKTQARGC